MICKFINKGGAKDINNFRENINQNYTPLVTSITYEGINYDYYFDTGMDNNGNNDINNENDNKIDNRLI